MIELAVKYLGITKSDLENKPNELTDKDKILRAISYFGLKAESYGTVDTYDRKLFLNESYTELAQLKVAVSIFFTLWHLTDDFEFKSRLIEGKNEKYEEIDKRFISLLAAITPSMRICSLNEQKVLLVGGNQRSRPKKVIVYNPTFLYSFPKAFGILIRSCKTKND